MNIVEKLRAAADFLEARPEVVEAFSPHFHLDLRTSYISDKSQLIALRKSLGSVKKNFWGDDQLDLETEIVPDVKVSLATTRSTACERVQVGEEVIPAEPEKVVPAKPERIEPVYEWKCGSLLEGSDG